MEAPVVSSNLLPLSSPYRLHGALQLLLCAVVVALVWMVWPDFYPNFQAVRESLAADRPEPDPELVFRTLIQGLGLVIAAFLVLRNTLGGLHRLLSFFVPVGVPGTLDGAKETADQLFVHRVFGHFDRRTSLVDKAFVRLAPRMMYLTRPGMNLLRAASSLRGFFWCGLAFLAVALARPAMDWPWGVLVVVIAAKAVFALALFLLTPPQPTLQVSEERRHFEHTGNPVNFYNHIDKTATELRRGTFPNRVFEPRKEPDVTNVQPGVTSKFAADLVFETQPWPVARSGSLPALLLGLAAVVAGAVAVALLLYPPAAPAADAAPPWLLGRVLTALTAAVYCGRFFARALDLLQVFRFESNLFWVELKGSFASSAIGLGDGRGGQFFAERRSIQSDTYAVVHAAKIITEASGRDALRAPRIVVNTTTDEDFANAFAKLLGGMTTFQDSTSTLPTITLDKAGVKDLVQANLAVTEGMSRATVQGGLPTGAAPNRALPPAAGETRAGTPPPIEAGATAGSPDESEMKVCPECGEKVRLVARKCRFCNHRFDETAPT
ncbi:MAG TPA: hypothetical protein VLD18_14335 [Verrucomicrobiae bacterium]|nr:hypothetical protein [Verrucomicrobiae bacterium]